MLASGMLTLTSEAATTVVEFWLRGAVAALRRLACDADRGVCKSALEVPW